MKATGIVRRIDDLGRVVIPKEIRRTMRIREGDPLEIFTSKEGEVIFKKYSAMENVNDMVQIFADALSKATGGAAAVCDTDSVVAVSGISKKDFVDKSISEEISAMLQERQSYIAKAGESKLVHLCSGSDKAFCEIVYPIISESDCVGAIISLSPESGEIAKDSDIMLCSTFASIMGKQMEE